MKSDWSPLRLKPQFSAAEQRGRTNESAETQQQETRRRIRGLTRIRGDWRGDAEENEGEKEEEDEGEEEEEGQKEEGQEE